MTRSAAPSVDLYVPTMATLVRNDPKTATERLFEIELPGGQPLGHQPGQFVEVSGTDGEVALFDYSTPGDWWDVVGELEEDAADADTTAKIWLGAR